MVVMSKFADTVLYVYWQATCACHVQSDAGGDPPTCGYIPVTLQPAIASEGAGRTMNTMREALSRECTACLFVRTGHSHCNATVP